MSNRREHTYIRGIKKTSKRNVEGVSGYVKTYGSEKNAAATVLDLVDRNSSPFHRSPTIEDLLHHEDDHSRLCQFAVFRLATKTQQAGQGLPRQCLAMTKFANDQRDAGRSHD